MKTRDKDAQQSSPHETHRAAQTRRAPSERDALQRGLGNRRLLQLRRKLRGGNALQRSVPAWIDALGLDRGQYERGQQIIAQEEAAETLTLPTHGEALPPAIQARAEAHMGVDLNDVQLVRNANDTTRPLGAQAYAAECEGGGHTVALDSSVDLNTSEGAFTLMHEIAHVGQQKRGQTGALEGVGGDEGVREALEKDADQQAKRMM